MAHKRVTNVPHRTKEGRVIDAVSLRQAGKDLKIDPRVLKGVAIGMGIELTACAGRIFISKRDYDRLAKQFEKSQPRIGA